MSRKSNLNSNFFILFLTLSLALLTFVTAMTTKKAIPQKTSEAKVETATGIQRSSKTLPNKAIRLTEENQNAIYVKPVRENTKVNGPTTVEAWVKPIKPAGGSYAPPEIICKPLTNAQLPIPYCLQLGVHYSSFRPYLTVDANNQQYSIQSSILIQNNNWYHLAFTIDPEKGVINLFVNGNLAGNININSPLTINDPNLGYVIGAAGYTNWSDNVENYGYYFDGLIDEVRISSSIRYSGPFTPQQEPFKKDQDTVALYHLDSNASDSAAPRDDGTVIGTVTYETL